MAALTAPLIAPPCRCDRPQVWDDDAPTCLSCGRDVVTSDAHDGNDRWIELEAAIERGAMRLRERARAAGVDTRNTAAYRRWLELYGEAYAPGIDAAVPR